MADSGTRELTRAELAAIYRGLNPGARYLGDPPELWFKDVLLQQIRVCLRETTRLEGSR